MKKIVIILAIIITILCINKEENIRIPKEAIRFRVIANTDSKEDQQLKKEVVKSLSKDLQRTQKQKTLQEARNFIKEQIPSFEQTIQETLEKNNSQETFHINYGKNYFPEKEYNNVIYEEGEYESLVVTLGEGDGQNFWCVLFPPLCFVEENQVEYKSIIKELIEKYF